jgi:DNA-binding response OmpR family regulator
MILPQNIIIVEDEVITQRYLQDIFAQYDVTVSGCFTNAKEALAGVRTLKCDMILMDINIKGPKDGIQLAREILNVFTLPIVFITAHNDDNTLEELLELAPYGFVGKPFSSKELIVAIQIAQKRFLTHNAQSKLQNKKNEKHLFIDENYTYSLELSELYKNNSTINLNQKQSILLKILIENINHTVHYELLIFHIWGEIDVSDSALRTLVYSLRKLLPDLPIVSQSKVGYRLSTKQR